MCIIKDPGNADSEFVTPPLLTTDANLVGQALHKREDKGSGVMPKRELYLLQPEQLAYRRDTRPFLPLVKGLARKTKLMHQHKFCRIKHVSQPSMQNVPKHKHNHKTS